MIVYIPFNTLDFNSLFATLSISPRSFYPIRGFSYKRSTETIHNPTEDSLLAYTLPIFSNRNEDLEGGTPALLELALDEDRLGKVKSVGDISVYQLRCSVYFTGAFRIVFRTGQELEDTLNRSLKSIETKYSKLARENSRVIKSDEDVIWRNDPIVGFSSKRLATINDVLHTELQLNRATGAILGYSIGVVRGVSPEANKLQMLLRELNNVRALYFNAIADGDAKSAKGRLKDCLAEISKCFESHEPLVNQLLMHSTGLRATDIETDKAQEYLGISKFELIIEGLLSKRPDNLPNQLVVELADRSIGHRFNTKFPDNYAKKLKVDVDLVIERSENLISEQKKFNDFQDESLMSVILENAKWSVRLPSTINADEQELLNHTLLFFISYESPLIKPDDLHRQREDILKEFGRHLGKRISKWSESPARTYLLNLINSFKSLTVQFDIKNTEFDTLKALGLIFTKGREYQKFINELPNSEFKINAIPYAIWGCVYGASSLPKTVTCEVVEREDAWHGYIKRVTELNESVNRENLIIISEARSLEAEIPLVPRTNNDSTTNQIESDVEGIEQSVKDSKTVDNEVVFVQLELLLSKERGFNEEEFQQLVKNTFNQVFTEPTQDLFDDTSGQLAQFKELLAINGKSVKGFGPAKVRKVSDYLRSIVQPF